MRLLQYADALLALSAEHGFALWRSLALINRGWGLAALGRVDDGLPLLTTGMAELHDMGSDWGVPIYLTMLADAYRMAGKPHDALAHLAEAQRLADASHEAWVGAEIHRLRGDVLLCTGDLAAAEASYHEAIALARRQSAKLFELRSATSLARVWRDKGHPAEARDMLAPVYAWFTEGFDAPDARSGRCESDTGRARMKVVDALPATKAVSLPQ
jgi:predicted ATPase